MLIEYLRILFVLLVAPVLTSIVSLPVLFSKTYIRTYIADPYDFSKETAKQYIYTTSFFLAPIALVWSFGLAMSTLFATEVTQSLSQNLLGIFIISALTYISFFSTQEDIIQSQLTIETDFHQSERKHTIIMFGVTFLQTVLFFFVFAVLFLVL